MRLIGRYGDCRATPVQVIVNVSIGMGNSSVPSYLGVVPHL
jgi:hypothetical protein